MLMVACFNFVTIALGSAAGRLKEIGIRKTTGADKSQLIAQFLVENYILCFVAILGGIVFAWSATIPFINSMVVFDIPSGYFSNVKLWVFLGGLLAFIGLVSGAYPAFYISKFQPVEILRGTRKIAEKKTLTRALTTIQFVLTIITISFSTFVGSLDESLSQDDWGYDESSILVMPVENDEHFSELQRAAGQVPNVEFAAGTNHHIGATKSRVALHVDASDQRAYYFSVGPSYLTTMGLRVENGRAFGESHSTADSASVVVNQSFVSAQDWSTPIGRSLRIGEQPFTIVGVVEDVLLDPLLGKHEPVIFGLSRPDRFNRIVLRVANQRLDQVTESMRRISEEKFPEIVFSSYRQEEVLYNEFQGLSVFMGYVAAFALFISCMGLFGLASQKVSRRIKEIGVRKAMGASAGNIIFLVNREFLVMLGTATLIATPLCYFVFSNSFFRFTEVELPTNLTPYILANVLVFMVAAISLSTQSYRLMNVIPADVLRYD